MSRIKGKDTSPEVALRRVLHRLGLRFRVHRTDLPGRPDIVLPRYKAVIMVHGCFWHHHDGCKIAHIPKSNVTFWEEKFARNMERDDKVVQALQALGWRVFVIWECELDSPRKAEEKGSLLASSIREV